MKFTFKKPSPGFLQGTSVIGSGLVSLKTLALPTMRWATPPRSSARARSWSRARCWAASSTLTARKDYDWGPAKLAHQGRAYLDGIKYVVTPEDSVRIGALLAGPGRRHPPGPGL